MCTSSNHPEIRPICTSGRIFQPLFKGTLSVGLIIAVISAEELNEKFDDLPFFPLLGPWGDAKLL